MRNLSLCLSVILEAANNLIELRPSKAVAVIYGRGFLPAGRINGLGRDADYRTRVPQYTRVLCPADQVCGAPFFEVCYLVRDYAAIRRTGSLARRSDYVRSGISATLCFSDTALKNLAAMLLNQFLAMPSAPRTSCMTWRIGWRTACS